MPLCHRISFLLLFLCCPVTTAWTRRTCLERCLDWMSWKSGERARFRGEWEDNDKKVSRSSAVRFTLYLGLSSNLEPCLMTEFMLPVGSRPVKESREWDVYDLYNVFMFWFCQRFDSHTCFQAPCWANGVQIPSILRCPQFSDSPRHIPLNKDMLSSPRILAGTLYQLYYWNNRKFYHKNTDLSLIWPIVDI